MNRPGAKQEAVSAIPIPRARCLQSKATQSATACGALPVQAAVLRALADTCSRECNDEFLHQPELQHLGLRPAPLQSAMLKRNLGAAETISSMLCAGLRLVPAQ